jgi:nitroimidazol reductase NimA-like FMN-containing flavoprotein (pyridoxamine 5'-phosphate oxidase superfamily)
MNIDAELARRAMTVIDSNKYMTLGTADSDGEPWVTPVYFTPDRYTDFYWVSTPGSKHSRNLERRPDLSIVIFDSQVPIGGAEAVYMKARAALVAEDELVRCAEFFASRLPELTTFTPEELTEPAAFRLYRATATEHSILIRGGDPTFGREADSRMPVVFSADDDGQGD